jgi:hypothetical protein
MPAGPVALAESLVHCTDHYRNRRAGPVGRALGGNFSVERCIFDRVGGFVEDVGRAEDIILGERLAGLGQVPWFDPGAVVRHSHRTDWHGFLQAQISSGLWLSKARVRFRLRGHVAARFRFPLLALFPYRLAKVLRTAILSRDIALYASLPVAVLGLAARSFGELAPELAAKWLQGRT